MKSLLLSSIIIFACVLPLAAQLRPDSTFNQKGYKLEAPNGAAYTTPGRSTLLDDGGIVHAGSQAGKPRLWKYTSAGLTDSSFGNNGTAQNIVLNSYLGNFQKVKDVEELEDGRLVVLIENYIWTSSPDYWDSYIALAVFNADGSVDSNFNGTGCVRTRPDPGFCFVPKTLAVQENGNTPSFYVGGWAYEYGHATCPIGVARWFVCKFSNTGNLDPSFNSTGLHLQSAALISPTASRPMSFVHDLLWSDGKLRALGALHLDDGAYFSFQMDANGIFDNSYWSNGRKIYPVNWAVGSNALTSAEFFDDGSAFYHSITSRNFGPLGDTQSVSILKTGANGAIENSFGSSGSISITYHAQQYPIFALRQDHSFLLNYYRPHGANHTNQWVVFQNFHSNGNLDSSFGINGILKTQIIQPNTYLNESWIYDAMFDPSETKLYVLASSQEYVAPYPGSCILMRYTDPDVAPLSIGKLNSSNSFIVYPNPTSGQTINIETQELLTEILLCDLSGRKTSVQVSQKDEKSYRVSWSSDLPSGQYYLLLKSAAGVRSIPIIIKK